MTAAAPTVLALDCSAASCSAALWRADGQGGALAAHRFEAMARGQAEALMPMVDGVMADAGAAYRELDLIAATVGPGSFTGLRIGLAAARGLALAAGVPVLGLTSFAAVAAAVPAAADAPSGNAGRGRLAVVIDDRRGGLYWQEFDEAGQPADAAAAVAADDVTAFAAARLRDRPLRIAGDGAALLRAALGATPGLVFTAHAGPPDAADIARLAGMLAPDFRAGRPVGLPPVPLYLRPPDVSTPPAAARGG
jgi:tRNA threonylcarbamoyladenosine biosynthesis protein TsaB